MKNYFLSIILVVFTLNQLQSQIKIGNNPQDIDAASVLELESNNRVLVITRVSDTEMNAITPLQGALIYNTDEECVFFYNNNIWVNLCTELNTFNVDFSIAGEDLVLTDSNGDSVSVPLSDLGVSVFTSNPIFNPEDNDNTIVITENDDNVNIEVGEITGFNIVDSSINGFLDIQTGSIVNANLQDDSVDRTKIDANIAGIGLIQAPDGSLDVDVRQFSGAGTLSSPTNTLEITGNPVNSIFNSIGLDVADDAITQVKIADNAVGTNEIIDAAVTTIKILDANVTASKLGNDIAGTGLTQLGNGSLEVDVTAFTGDGAISSTANSITLTGTPATAILEDVNVEVNVDGATLEVDATNGVQIADDGVTTDKIGTAGITDANRVLGTDAAGDPEWQDAATIATNLGEDVLSTDGSITGIANDAALVAMDLEVNVDGTTLEVDATNGVQVVNDGITNTQIADNAIQTENILDASVTPAKLADGTAAGEILQWDGTNWVLVDNSALTITEIDGIVGNEVTNATTGGSLTLNGTGTLADPLTLDVTDGGIGTVELAADAVDNSRVADNAVQTENILDANITPAKLADGSTAGEILQWDGANWVLVDDSALTITEIDGIVGNEVTNATTGGSLTLNGTGTLADPLTLDVTDGGIGTVELAADAVDNSRVADDAIQTENIADNNITPAKIEQGANGQVLTTDGTGDVVWAAPAEATATGTAGSIFFADGKNGLAEDNTQLFWDDGSNRLGVGTNAIGTGIKLRVANGDIQAEGILNTSAGAVGNPPYSFNTDEDTGMWRDGADELVLVAGGTEGLRIDMAGAVTTTTIPEVLELDGTILDINDDQGTVGQILSSTATGTDWIDSPQEITLRAQVPIGLGTAGAYTITNAAITATSIINLTVVENNPGNPIMIQLTAQAAGSFSVQIYEFIAGTPTAINATWNYIIVNP